METAIDRTSSHPGEGLPVIQSLESLSGSMFEILWRRRWTILLVCLLASAGGLLYLQNATPRYTSTSRLCVEQAALLHVLVHQAVAPPCKEHVLRPQVMVVVASVVQVFQGEQFVLRRHR